MALSTFATLISVVTPILHAQSPPAQATIVIGGKKLVVAYSAPSVRGRKIFGEGGILSKDPTYPVWRAGANNATTFQTEADLAIGAVPVPKGIYTFYVLIRDPNAWELIISKETGQWGLDYHPNRDLGRVKMEMSKPPAPIEKLKYTLTSTGASAAKLEIAWENHVASVPVNVR